jgi:hypothetical protein
MRPSLITLCAIAIGYLLAAPSTRAQTVTVNPELTKVIEGAKKEGKLLLRSTTSVNGAADGAKVAQAGIKKMFGVDLDVQWVPGPAFAPLAAATSMWRRRFRSRPISLAACSRRSIGSS